MSASPQARKRAEMLAKLDAAPAEFAAWRAAAAAPPLNKHQSQIRRITTRLEALAGQLRTDLDDAGAGLLAEWTTFELVILDLHHLWDFFRAKFALRYPQWLREPLTVADELVWACYSPAQQRATDAGGVDPATVREPPLTFYGIGSTPVALSRHSVYERAGAANRLYTAEFAAELRSLPVPAIAMPWHQIGHVPDLMLLVHETGHQVEADFGLTAELRAAARGGLDRSPDPGWWLDRLAETFADVYGVLGAGAAYVTALIDFLAAPPAALAAETAPDDYPTALLRIRVALAALEQTCPDDPRIGTLQAVLDDTDPGPFGGDVAPLVNALLTHRFPVFGDVPLTEVLSFAALRKQSEIDVAALATERRRPESGNPRGVLAAAALRFADDPEAYERLRAGPRAVESVIANETAGPRFRGGAGAGQDFDAIDRAAAAGMHDRLLRAAAAARS